MDKFGIFKLLNSFFNFYEQNKSRANVPPPDEKKDISDLISSLLPTKNEKQPPNQKKSSAPLQNSMLATMTSHDQFIKRVKQSQQKKNPASTSGRGNNLF